MREERADTQFATLDEGDDSCELRTGLNPTEAPNIWQPKVN